ncbi:PP2C family protein-serine/threonine phosphatase [Pseudonocardia oroxyli]|uniref:Serine phosphatase RsbU, regulator of sigma subunit n=1 Tax=Pseudonocardia oroxyli TaxID=366584 RepID=A0A1G7PWF1_PSEOR|nr:PP2C family protein-serine/threonine phosphatase [Pseudonocardia oroxyli]SDF90584.1 Serine phosphatase RsbU, regulator of sigma subunit [Pseudonocardia oroxyli]
MPSPRVPPLDLRELLDLAEAASPVEAVDVVADAMAAMLSATDVWFWITDLSGRAVARFGGTGANAARVQQRGVEDVPVVPLAGTVYETVLRSQRPDLRSDRDGSTLVVPVTDRGDTMGVVEVRTANPPDATVVASVAAAARALAYVVVGARRHTDLFEWAQRSAPFSLAAEIQRRLLPSAYTCEAGQFTVSGWLEPANAVGGDTFDYALDRDSLHLSITDAVGHDVTAALLATVLVGSLRNGRRHQLDLRAQAASANDALVASSGPGEFVTGQLVRVDRVHARLAIVNAGHPLPYRVRGGAVTTVDLAVDLPFGLYPHHEFAAQPVDLRPGDRIVLVTDGILERNAERLDVQALLARTADRHPREVVYTLGEEVLAATGGDLRDDATVVCLDWHG